MAEDLARHEALETADDLRLALPLRGAASGVVDGGSVGAHAHDDHALLRLAAREPHPPNHGRGGCRATPDAASTVHASTVHLCGPRERWCIFDPRGDRKSTRLNSSH